MHKNKPLWQWIQGERLRKGVKMGMQMEVERREAEECLGGIRRDAEVR